jgi:S-formylglutathione hydrolase
MTCSIYLPHVEDEEKLPCLFFLSGLTCTDENVCQKSGAFKTLSELKIVFVAPDTSPRGVSIAGDSDSWDFGVGAGYYVDATQGEWRNHYRMQSYVATELPMFLSEHFPVIDQRRFVD